MKKHLTHNRWNAYLICLLSILFLCLLKNIASNLAGHYIYNSRNILMWTIEKVAGLMRIDPMDERISVRNYINFNEPFTYNHNSANGQLIVVLFLLSITCIIVHIIRSLVKNRVLPRWRSKDDEKDGSRGFIIIAFVVFVVFLATLKYTENRARYEIPFFALLCTAVCLTLQQSLGTRMKENVSAIIIVVALVEIISLASYHIQIKNQFKIYGRQVAYFSGFTAMHDGYQKSCDIIKSKGYKDVGIVDSFIFEYPIWVMAGETVEHIESVNVTSNATSALEDMDYRPDCIWYIDIVEQTDNNIRVHDTNYNIVSRFTDGIGYYTIAEREGY